MKQDNSKTMEQTVTVIDKKVWNEPQIVLLSVKDATLGTVNAGPDVGGFS
jgi:hypothetical protein